jgi:hypothetical protein
VAADDADDLYGLALDAFVPERDALAKRLRGEGRRDDAAAVKALRKPSVAAWAVNQAVRSQPKAARTLWDAGDALIAAQDDLLGGSGDPRALRAAVEEERAAVDALVEAARGLLTSEGRDLGDTTLERVRETLHAAAIDPEAREDVAAGRATRELAHAGLGPFGASIARPVAPRARKAAPAGETEDGEAGAKEGSGRRGATKAPRGKAADEPTPRRSRAEASGTKAEAAEERGADERRARRSGAKASVAKAEAAEQRRAAEARREEERRAAAEREETRKDAARRRAAAERELREAARALEKAQRAADRADARLREAEAAADEANAALEDARDRHGEAEAELDAARADEAEAAEE